MQDNIETAVEAERDIPPDNIWTALLAAQAEFGPARKTSDNPHFRSKYADLQACIEAVAPALNRHGILYRWETLCEGDGWVMVCVLEHAASRTQLSCGWPIIASKQDAQGFASGSTYARRYSLMAVCGLAPEDDDGNAAAGKAPSLGQQAQRDAEHLKGRTEIAIAERQDDWLRANVLAKPPAVRAALARMLTPNERQYLSDLHNHLRDAGQE
jgi:hypothetical protein